MLASVNIKGKVSDFPIEIFGKEIEQSFRELANEFSVPLNFFGAAGLWSVASLAGNMYKTELNGRIKSIIYMMMLGPSSLGKTVVYDKLCGDVVAKQDEILRANYVAKKRAYTDRMNAAKLNKEAFQEIEPQRTIRTATNGTLEAFMKYAETNPAGYGIYFDEGKALYSGGSYKKENNSVDFWNKAWNGKVFNELRVDTDRERYVTNPSISILAGMQSDRVNEMFNKDTIASGLLNRFLFSSSGYIELNEDIDHFSAKKEVCDDWKIIIRKLYDDGIDYFDQDSQTKLIPFTPGAKVLYNELSKENTKTSNELIRNIKKGDESELFVGYTGKLYAYFGRFVLLCAIIKDVYNPVITEQCVHDAQKIYNYFRYEAKKLLVKINDESTMNLTENESKLYNTLPERFTFSEAIDISSRLNLTRSFFRMTYTRKFSKMGYMKQDAEGYLKLV